MHGRCCAHEDAGSDSPVGRCFSWYIGVRRHIIVDNEIGVDVDLGDLPIWEYNLVFGSDTNYRGTSDQTGRAGNISLDPLFIDALLGNYDLAAGSPAIDRGSPIAAPAVDFLSRPRPFDGDFDGIARVDIGAFEAIPEAPTVVLALLGQIALVVGRYGSRASSRPAGS